MRSLLFWAWTDRWLYNSKSPSKMSSLTVSTGFGTGFDCSSLLSSSGSSLSLGLIDDALWWLSSSKSPNPSSSSFSTISPSSLMVFLDPLEALELWLLPFSLFFSFSKILLSVTFDDNTGGGVMAITPYVPYSSFLSSLMLLRISLLSYGGLILVPFPLLDSDFASSAGRIIPTKDIAMVGSIGGTASALTRLWNSSSLRYGL